MKVTLIGTTETLGRFPHGFESDPKGVCYYDTEELIEFAGRACYQSWDKPNPATRHTEDYIANIVAQGHLSVLEHASATFYIEGVSRSLTHELIRHRHLSFSQLSQRFVDESDVEFVVPPAIRDVGVSDKVWNEAEIFDAVRGTYDGIVEVLTERGLTRKQAREAARSVLPNCTETKIVVSGNMRAWREFIQKRWTVHADAEIRELAGVILTELRKVAPSVFADIACVPEGSAA